MGRSTLQTKGQDQLAGVSITKDIKSQEDIDAFENDMGGDDEPLFSSAQESAPTLIPDALLGDQQLAQELSANPGIANLISNLMQTIQRQGQELALLSTPHSARQRLSLERIVNVMDETEVSCVTKATGQYSDGQKDYHFSAAGQLVKLRKPFADRLKANGVIDFLHT